MGPGWWWWFWSSARGDWPIDFDVVSSLNSQGVEPGVSAGLFLFLRRAASE